MRRSRNDHQVRIVGLAGIPSTRARTDGAVAPPPHGFFGRRKGRRLRPRQAGLMATLLPGLAIDLGAPAPTELARLFPIAVNDVCLEIGFGGGEHLVAQAETSPRFGFIGCEPYINGMVKALAAIQARALANVRLHFGDASALLDWLPAGSISRVDLICPDPWPKRRHWKRRFVQDARMAELARVLRPSGEFRFVTDCADYAAWTLIRVMRSRAFDWTAEQAGDWRDPWPGFTGTRYEAKANRAGRASSFLVFRRK